MHKTDDDYDDILLNICEHYLKPVIIVCEDKNVLYFIFEYVLAKCSFEFDIVSTPFKSFENDFVEYGMTERKVIEDFKNGRLSMLGIVGLNFRSLVDDLKNVSNVILIDLTWFPSNRACLNAVEMAKERCDFIFSNKIVKLAEEKICIILNREQNVEGRRDSCVCLKQKRKFR